MPKFCYDELKHKLPCKQPCQNCKRLCNPKKVESIRAPRAVLRADELPMSNLVVIIGTHGAGKTQLALSIAASLTLTACPLPVLLFASGADKRTLMRRLSAAWKPARLRAASLFVKTTPRLWPVEIWLAARRIERALNKHKARLGLIIVDGLHHVGGRNYAQKVSDFKILAREMGLAIVILARPHPSLTVALRQERIASIPLPIRDAHLSKVDTPPLSENGRRRDHESVQKCAGAFLECRNEQGDHMTKAEMKQYAAIKKAMGKEAAHPLFKKILISIEYRRRNSKTPLKKPLAPTLIDLVE